LEKPWLKFWPEGVPQTIGYPKISLPQMLRNAAQKYPDNSATVFYGARISYRELDNLTDRFATALQHLEVKKGDRVAIYLPNCPQFVIGYYGALKAGAIVVACSPLYKGRELEYQLNDSGAETILTLDALYPVVSSVRERTRLRNVISTSLLDYFPPVLGVLARFTGKLKKIPCPGTINLKELLSRYPASASQVSIDPKKDIALLQYTGGTTGIPKGAMITHFNMVVNAVQIACWLPTIEGKDIHLSVLPFFHIYGMSVAMNSPIYAATTVILIPRFEAKTVLEAIVKYQTTVFCGVPTMYIALLNYPGLKKYDLSSIRSCFSGAAPLAVEVQKRFEEVTGGRLVEGYGLTETSPVTHINPLDKKEKNRPGSIGIPIQDTESKIVDLDTGATDLPPEETGELVIRGPQVMTGYWNRQEETERALRNGWFYTGDISRMDRDGYFYIVDRKKDMINVSGLKVWPREVEEVLYEHPAVKEAGVIGISDPYRGETVKAFVSLKDEYEGKVTQEEVIKFCKERIASYKAPQYVEFRKEMPKTAVGKILRRVLKEETLKRPA
jgi:long-chain acyl-CoA synthetase